MASDQASLLGQKCKILGFQRSFQVRHRPLGVFTGSSDDATACPTFRISRKVGFLSASVSDHFCRPAFSISLRSVRQGVDPNVLDRCNLAKPAQRNGVRRVSPLPILFTQLLLSFGQLFLQLFTRITENLARVGLGIFDHMSVNADVGFANASLGIQRRYHQ